MGPGPSMPHGETDRLARLRRAIERARFSTLYSERLRDVRLESLEDYSRVPLTTRTDLQEAGLTGTRAVPVEAVCHYGETSGTTGAANSTWLTAADLQGNARMIAERHPEIFGPGRVILNRFPFMAAPAHLIQLVGQLGSGVVIPGGNINWDVPFSRALDLARKVGAHVIAGMPLEPVFLAQLARAQGLDPAKDFALDTFFLGGSPLPPVLQRRIEQTWGARVVELYGSTETMLLGTSCGHRSLHLETDIVHCEILRLDADEPAPAGDPGRLVVTTLAIEGSPMIRLDTEDVVRVLPPCACGDPRLAIVVLGRRGEEVRVAGRDLYAYELIEAAASAADALDSSVFFTVAVGDRLVVRIEVEEGRDEPSRIDGARAAHRDVLGDVPFEVECTRPNEVLDVENLARSPQVYKPVLVNDWSRTGSRRLVSVTQGMIEWPRPTLPELLGFLRRTCKNAWRASQLRRRMKVAKAPRQ